MSRRGVLWSLLVAISMALVVAAVEIAGLAYFATRHGGLFYNAAHQPPPPAPSLANTAVFHPYFAFGVRPGVPIRRFLEPEARLQRYLAGGSEEEPAWTRLRANNFGFYAQPDYPVHEPESFLVGLFGGSVAHSLAMQSGERIAERLAERPDLGGRRVRVLNFAAGGYKQPQQVLVLAYFLSIGQRFDYVVNLDGFNEAVLGGINATRRIDPSMPSLHHVAGLEALTAPTPAALEARRELEALQRRRRELGKARAEARFAGTFLVWDLLHRRAEARHATLVAEPPPRDGARSAVTLASELAGPSGARGTERIARDWARGSILMAELARQAGARYLHVLQPNQYVSERTFGTEEARIALNEGSAYARFTRRLYPALAAEAARLHEHGVAFESATGLFDDVPEIVYADDCCHYNQRGNDLLADFVLARMRTGDDLGARTR